MIVEWDYTTLTENKTETPWKIHATGHKIFKFIGQNNTSVSVWEAGWPFWNTTAHVRYDTTVVLQCWQHKHSYTCRFDSGYQHSADACRLTHSKGSSSRPQADIKVNVALEVSTWNTGKHLLSAGL